MTEASATRKPESPWTRSSWSTTVVSGNTNAACIMIGEKCVHLMLAAR